MGRISPTRCARRYTQVLWPDGVCNPRPARWSAGFACKRKQSLHSRLSRSHALRGNAVKARCAASCGQRVEMWSVST